MDVEDAIPRAVRWSRFVDIVCGTALVEGAVLAVCVAGLSVVLFGRGAGCAGVCAPCVGVPLAIVLHFLGLSAAMDADQRAARSSASRPMRGTRRSPRRTVLAVTGVVLGLGSMLLPVAGVVTAFVLALTGSSLASVLAALGGLAAGCVLVVSTAGIEVG